MNILRTYGIEDNKGNECFKQHFSHLFEEITAYKRVYWCSRWNNYKKKCYEIQIKMKTWLFIWLRENIPIQVGIQTHDTDDACISTNSCQLLVPWTSWRKKKVRRVSLQVAARWEITCAIHMNGWYKDHCKFFKHE